MTTLELVKILSKGRNNFTLTAKQANWLKSVSKNDGIYSDSGNGDGIIAMEDKRRFKIKQCSVFASGGSYVGSRTIDKWSVKLYYMIQFSDTGITEFRSVDDVERIKAEGVHSFNII